MEVRLLVLEISQFLIYQGGGCRHLGFFFIIFHFPWQMQSGGQVASLLQILSKSVKRFLRATAYMQYSAYMPWQFRLSVCLSVHLSHGWISQKRLKLGSHNFDHTVAPSL